MGNNNTTNVIPYLDKKIKEILTIENAGYCEYLGDYCYTTIKVTFYDGTILETDRINEIYKQPCGENCKACNVTQLKLESKSKPKK